ncbi:ketopantoate reductase family protein [Rhizorhabdus dicambivorans]|uniref:ketopantoate reductase family protein n=1 Tax=Rhizorhabdus dicambivorans TaxID=1850238 RepID=UPI001EE08999|nr:ketopantoate reductase family protein [Rhizorhabdus dicambivorans]
MREVCIVGAGAMGCLFAARMSLAGSNVTLVDVDSRRLETIASMGLELHDDDGIRLARPLACIAKDVAGPVDILVLFTKGTHSAAAIRSMAHVAHRNLSVLTLQNGIGNAELLASAFGADRVLMGTAHVPADLSPPNRVSSHGHLEVHLGPMTPVGFERARATTALLFAAGFNPVMAANVGAVIWEKLAFNAALNALAMVTGSTNGAMNNAPALRIAHAIVDEATAVAHARGLELSAQDIKLAVNRAVADHAAHKASMLQDREAGRTTEIEFINGAIVRSAENLGIPTPVTATMADLVRVIEAARG